MRLEALGDRLRFDFTGTDPQMKGPLNAPVGVSFGGVNPRTNRNFVFYESYNGGLGLLREYEMLADRAMKKIPSKFGRRIKRGQHLRILTPGGGGFGGPNERDHAALMQDYREGKASAAKILKDYGIDVSAGRNKP